LQDKLAASFFPLLTSLPRRSLAEGGSHLKGVLPKACFNWEDQGSLGDFEQEDFG
jgi:hypothetical protein